MYAILVLVSSKTFGSQIISIFNMSGQNLTLYTWDTPNGAKPVILCEELGTPCNYKPMDMFSSDLRSDWYMRINPNSKIPALEDGSLKLFESGAILLYLVDTYDTQNKVSFERGTAAYWEMVAWVVMQVAGLGPMQGASLLSTF